MAELYILGLFVQVRWDALAGSCKIRNKRSYFIINEDFWNKWMNISYSRMTVLH